MNQSNSRQSSRQGQAPHEDRAPPARDIADYRRRLRAAGIDPDGEIPEDIDAFRYELARRIHMYLNTWHGCPESFCRRQRGCMAPNIACSNVERLSPEEEERRWREVQADVYKALDAFIVEHGLQDE
jgi:hypothetical protein